MAEPETDGASTGVSLEALLAEWLCGALAGSGLAFLSLRETLAFDPRPEAIVDTLSMAWLLGEAGYVLGAPGGIALAGQWLNRPGSLGLALLGSLLGGGVAWLVGPFLRIIPDPRTHIVAFGLAALVLALVGYNIPTLRRSSSAS